MSHAFQRQQPNAGPRAAAVSHGNPTDVGATSEGWGPGCPCLRPAFSLTSATAPVLGLLTGGWFMDHMFGGYRTSIEHTAQVPRLHAPQSTLQKGAGKSSLPTALSTFSAMSINAPPTTLRPKDPKTIEGAQVLEGHVHLFIWPCPNNCDSDAFAWVSSWDQKTSPLQNSKAEVVPPPPCR